MSGVSSMSARISAACASMRPERRSPPSALGRASPCVRSKARQRIALDALTPNRSAAWRQDNPVPIAASTRVRRSSDSAFDMPAGLHPAGSLNHSSPDLGIPSDSLSSDDALIRQLAFECGYDSSSIRERLYVASGPDRQMAGLLLY